MTMDFKIGVDAYEVAWEIVRERRREKRRLNARQKKSNDFNRLPKT